MKFIKKMLCLSLFFGITQVKAEDFSFRVFEKAINKNDFFSEAIKKHASFNNKHCKVISYKEIKKYSTEQDYSIQLKCDDNTNYLMKLPKNNGNSELINCNGINHDIEVCQLNDEEKKLAGKWNYIESRDEMRDKVILGAILTSDNYIDLDSPYGKTKLKLNVVKHDNNYKLMISTDENPSFDCFRDCKIDVKFDNNKVESFSVNIGRDRNVLFVVKAESFIKKMKSSEKLIVEVDIFRNGSNQYKFSPNLLKDF